MTIHELSLKLNVPENWLMAVFELESSNNTKAVNKISNAVGLIQFMPKTATALGTSTALLYNMTYEQQLNYVYLYLKPYKNKINRFVDLYLSVFFPRAIDKPDSYVLKTKKLSAQKIALWNTGFDENKDKQLTVFEIRMYLQRRFPFIN